MFEFEGFIAFCTFELSQDRALVMADHVTLEAVDVCEGFVANLAGLETNIKLKGVGGGY